MYAVVKYQNGVRLGVVGVPSEDLAFLEMMRKEWQEADSVYRTSWYTEKTEFKIEPIDH